MKTRWSLLLLLFVTVPSLAVEPATTATFIAPPATPAVHSLSAELWARPRSGEAVSEMPPVRDAVRELLAADGGRLVIRYPGGEEGSLWAEELHAWLIALGIEVAMLDMRPGSSRPDHIELFVEPNLSK